MKTLGWILFAIIVVCGAVFFARDHKRAAPAATGSAEQAQVQAGKAKQDIRDQVVAFGAVLKNVSLLAPTAGQDIAREYAPFVSRSLLSNWTAHPEIAPGRDVSSPWPDHIDVIEIELTASGAYHVRAMLVYMTSAEVAKGGDAGSAMLDLTMIDEDGAWKIDRYDVVRKNNPNAPRSSTDRPQLE